MSTEPRTPEQAFEFELEHFRRETNDATCFYCVPRAIAFAAADPVVRRALNQAPLFWNLSGSAAQVGLFVVLGRIFDQSSPHNIDALIRMASDNAAIFGRQALEGRKRASGFNDDQGLQSYLAQAYVPVPDDFRSLRRSVADARRIYEAHFRDIRNEYIAHRAVSHPDAVAVLFGNAQISAIETLLASLTAIHNTLQELYLNGNPPVLRPRTISIEQLVAMPIEQMTRHSDGEIAIYETRRCLEQIVRGTQASVGGRRP
jgi:AbiU2